MNSTQSSLITAFFKSPPRAAEEGGEDAQTPTPTTNGDGGWSEGEGEREGRERGSKRGKKLTVNLCGLLNGSESPRLSSANHPLPPHSTPHNTSQNETSRSPVFGSSMRRDTLTWDTSSGTLSLKPPAMPTQVLTTPTTVSITDTKCCVTERGREEGEVRRGARGEVSGEVCEEVSGEVRREVGGEVRREVGGEVRREVRREVGGEVRREVRREVGEEVRRRSSRRLCSFVDYSMASDGSGSEGEMEVKRSRDRKRRRRLNSTSRAVCSQALERRERNKRRRRGCGVSDRQLVVRVKLRLLRHPHNCTGGGGDSPHSEPNPGNGTTDADSDVQITGCVKSVLSTTLNDSVVIVGATPSPLVPPIASPPPSTLSGPWAKIFSQTAQQKMTSCRQTREDTLTRGPSGPGSPPSHSPRKYRGLAAASPLRRSLSRSPRACRSPRPCSPLRSPRRRGGSTPSSPLRPSLTPRKLIPPTPTAAKRWRLDYDHAPFSGLVHVTQRSGAMPPRTLTSTTGHTINLRPPLTATHKPSFHFSLRSCVTSADPSPPSTARPLLTAVTTDQRQLVLEELAEVHSQERVHQIFHRYCQIRSSGTSRLQSHPHTHTSTPSLLPRTSQPATDNRERERLLCRVHVVSSENGALKVNREAYKSGHGRKSLRLRIKRIGSSELSSDAGDGGMTGTTAGPEPSAVAPGVGDGGRGEGERWGTELWSDVYRPQSREEVIGNKVKVQCLFEWLRTWKNKCSSRQNASDQLPLPATTKKRRRKQFSDLKGSESQSSRERSPTPEWVCGDDDFLSVRHVRRSRKRVVMSSSGSEGEEEEGESGEGVSSVVLLCGGVGCGKTASVYACAAELGCKVFEVNSSTVRSRGNLLATLKEATLSHQVSTQHRAPSDPVRAPSAESGRSSVPSANERGRGGGGKRGCGRKKAPRRDGILTFFRPQQSHEGEGGREGREGAAAGTQGGTSRPVALETCTVILLEEVDILFDSDRGFWSGVYELIASTRRPIILTCNDPRYELDCDYIKIVFEPPSLVELGMHMQLLCLSHDYHMTSDVAVQLADYLRADIRQVFLFLQFWTDISTSTPHTLTPHTPLPHIPGHQYSKDGVCPPPCLTRPWRSVEGCLPSSDGCQDMDMTAHCSEQHSCLDIATMETRSHDHHMMKIDDIMRPWWVCPEEPSSVIDELPVRESRWREERVTGELCEEVERGVGGVVRPSPVVWREYSRHVESVRQCLERCAEVFGCCGSRVGVATDGLPLLREICRTEQYRQVSNTKRRFRHYLKGCATVDFSELQSLPLTTRFTPSTL